MKGLRDKGERALMRLRGEKESEAVKGALEENGTICT
jgi:hypothetical protein